MASLKEVYSNLMSPEDLVSFKNEKNQEGIIERAFGKPPMIFTATILSGLPEQSADPNKKGADGSSEGAQFWFSRIRDDSNHNNFLNNPFDKKLSFDKAKRLINLHPLAYAPSADIGSPNAGEKWECRYVDKARTAITMVKKLGGDVINMSMWDGETLSGEMENNSNVQTVSEYTAVTDASNGKALKRVYVGTNAQWKNKVIYNGQIPAPLLSSSKIGALMIKESVTDLNNLTDAYQARFGFKMKLNDSYRSFDRQVATKAKWTAKGKPGFAATPGTSKHGWGFAVDYQNMDEKGRSISNGAASAKKWNPEGYKHGGAGFDSPTYKWMMENAPKYNFVNPPGMQKGGSGPDEPWHFQWTNSKMKTIIKKAPVANTGME